MSSHLPVVGGIILVAKVTRVMRWAHHPDVAATILDVAGTTPEICRAYRPTDVANGALSVSKMHFLVCNTPICRLYTSFVTHTKRNQCAPNIGRTKDYPATRTRTCLMRHIAEHFIALSNLGAYPFHDPFHVHSFFRPVHSGHSIPSLPSMRAEYRGFATAVSVDPAANGEIWGGLGDKPGPRFSIETLDFGGYTHQQNVR